MGLGNDFITAYTNASGLALEMSKTATQPNLRAQLDEKSCCRNKGCSSTMSQQVIGILISADLQLT
jgi:hypothetical protein